MPAGIPELPVVERAVLSAVLRSDGRLFDVAAAAGLTPASFNAPELRRIYAAMTGIALAGGRPDAVTVAQRLPDADVLVAEIYQAIATDVNFEKWVSSLKVMEAARAVRIAAAEYVESAGGLAPGDADAAISKLAGAAADARSVMAGRDVKSLREVADGLLDRSRYAAAVIPYFPPYTEGWRKIKHRKGEMHVICANTGAGKTCLAAGAVKEQLKAGLTAAYFCFESDSQQILGRISAQFCGIPHYIMQDYAPRTADLELFGKTVNDVVSEHGDRLFIRGCETGIRTAEDVRSELERIVHRAGHVDVVVVDFLQFMQAPPFLAAKSRLDQINWCVEKLHGIFTDFDAAGIVLAQINRAGQQTEGFPGLEHIKDSTLIAQLAHTVSFLYRDQRTPGAGGSTKFYSRKTRNQDPFMLELGWNGVGYESPRPELPDYDGRDGN